MHNPDNWFNVELMLRTTNLTLIQNEINYICNLGIGTDEDSRPREWLMWATREVQQDMNNCRQHMLHFLCTLCFDMYVYILE